MKHFRNVLQEWASDFLDISKIILAKILVNSVKLIKRLFSFHIHYYKSDSTNFRLSDFLGFLFSALSSGGLALFTVENSPNSYLSGFLIVIFTLVYFFLIWPISSFLFRQFLGLFSGTIIEHVVLEFAHQLAYVIGENYRLYSHWISSKIESIQENANRVDRKKKLDKDPDISRLTDDHDDIDMDFSTVEELIGKIN